MTVNTVEVNKLMSVDVALRAARHRQVELLGQVERNQGMPTFTGRLTLEQFADLTVVHNRRWADDAGESFDSVTQREIIDPHANGLAMFMLQGLVAATQLRGEDGSLPTELIEQLALIQDKVGRSAHYGLPQVTLVLTGVPDFGEVPNVSASTAMRLFLPAGRLFVVADGQHRREAARRVREFLNRVVADRRIPKGIKFYPAQEEPISAAELEAWIAVQDTFRSWTMISYEAHIGLTIEQARQMFTNYNCNVKPVKFDLNLAFDQSNPLNQFAKEWVQSEIARESDGQIPFDLRQLASIHGFLFLGKTTIKSAPYNVNQMLPVAKEFWTTVLQSPEWDRPGSLVREVPVLKALAKAWFYVFLARRNNRLSKAAQLRSFVRHNVFDKAWVESVPGLLAHTVPSDNDAGFRFSPAHNDIVARIVGEILQ
jgi:DNA-sulfur modification-associated